MGFFTLRLLSHFRSCEAKNRSYKRTKTNLNTIFFAEYTDNYSAAFTEYSVAEYSAGRNSAEYLAEYSADRIVGRSLTLTSPFS
jgi:hypothetical protein